MLGWDDADSFRTAAPRKERQRRWLLREGLVLLLTAAGLSWIVVHTGREPVQAGVRHGFRWETRAPIDTRFGVRRVPLFAALMFPAFYLFCLLACVYWFCRGWRRAGAGR
ncbi:MAG: hypothetical protein ACK47B_21650 [Armatimonadota bacterium]